MILDTNDDDKFTRIGRIPVGKKVLLYKND